MVYVARNKKEFERVCNLLCELNIKWLNKANCGWNIEIEKPNYEALREFARNFFEWHANHFEDFSTEINGQLLCLANEVEAALAKS